MLFWVLRPARGVFAWVLCPSPGVLAILNARGVSKITIDKIERRRNTTSYTSCLRGSKINSIEVHATRSSRTHEPARLLARHHKGARRPIPPQSTRKGEVTQPGSHHLADTPTDCVGSGKTPPPQTTSDQTCRFHAPRSCLPHDGAQDTVRSGETTPLSLIHI